MVIKVDAQGREMIKQLCDIALRHGGIANLQGVMMIVNSMETIVEDEVKTDAKE
jgi:hypothetical protein